MKQQWHKLMIIRTNQQRRWFHVPDLSTRIILDGQETVDEIKALAQRLKAMYPETQFYTSHCTGDHVFEVMKDVMGEQLQSFRCGTIIA